MGDNVKMAIADRFAAYVGELTKVVGHADRAVPRGPSQQRSRILRKLMVDPCRS
jgi:hypothetical protein